jgi:hypothetical protein
MKLEIRFPKVKNMGSIYSPMAFESSKDFEVIVSCVIWHDAADR